MFDRVRKKNKWAMSIHGQWHTIFTQNVMCSGYNSGNLLVRRLCLVVVDPIWKTFGWPCGFCWSAIFNTRYTRGLTITAVWTNLRNLWVDPVWATFGETQFDPMLETLGLTRVPSVVLPPSSAHLVRPLPGHKCLSDRGRCAVISESLSNHNPPPSWPK